MADLLDVAMAVYAADRRSLRDFKKEKTGQRRIHMRLAVREPELWESAEISEQLSELLSWLSGDVWSFEFARRESDPSPAESVRYLFSWPTDHPAEVSLFSGGLDSLWQGSRPAPRAQLIGPVFWFLAIPIVAWRTSNSSRSGGSRRRGTTTG